MSKKTSVTILGVAIMTLPFFGLPSSISVPIYVTFGLLLIFIARTGIKKKNP